MYFDLHLHPALKSFLTDVSPARRDDCWTIYRNFVDFLVGNIIDSQASLRQLDRSRTTLAVAAVYVLEDGLDDIGLLRNILPLITYLDRRMIKDIRPEHYWGRFLEKVAHLEASLDAGGPGAREFQILSAAPDENPVNNGLVLAVEGAHILQGGPGEGPLARLAALKQFRHRILYLTVAHFARNPYATQAFAMKLVNARKAPEFLPSGTGLTEAGRELIRTAYDETTGQRILIDVKHLSLSSRRDFYATKAEDPALRQLPVIASHVGVAGISWAATERARLHRRTPRKLSSLGQVFVEYRKPDGLRLGNLQSSFNPASINLYDEDLVAVLDSGGLIGLMLDQRQLGVNNKPEEYFAAADYERLENDEVDGASPVSPPVEVLSSSEERRLTAAVKRAGRMNLLHVVNPFTAASVASLKEMVTGPPEQKSASLPQPPVSSHVPRRLNRKRKKHLLHFVNNLLHVVAVGGARAWNHLCVGSDFDGLVDPPNNCQNVTDFADLEVHLAQIIRELIAQEGAEFSGRYHITDLEEQLRDVMYRNGKRFVTEWL